MMSDKATNGIHEKIVPNTKVVRTKAKKMQTVA